MGVADPRDQIWLIIRPRRHLSWPCWPSFQKGWSSCSLLSLSSYPSMRELFFCKYTRLVECWLVVGELIQQSSQYFQRDNKCAEVWCKNITLYINVSKWGIFKEERNNKLWDWHRSVLSFNWVSIFLLVPFVQSRRLFPGST